jgi:hypothetical protein
MEDNRSSILRYTPWLLAAIVIALAFYAWGSSFAWNFSNLSAYQFFPLLGLVAFSVMWSHYVIGIAKSTILKNSDLKTYFHYTESLVLACIVLHPGILIYMRFRDGYGLPPHSYETYVAPSMAWLTLLGSASLLAFLAFELHRWFGDKAWWRFVLAAGDIAMLAAFYHGLRLGSQLQGGWYHYVWLFYGIVLIGILGYKYVTVIRNRL